MTKLTDLNIEKDGNKLWHLTQQLNDEGSIYCRLPVDDFSSIFTIPDPNKLLLIQFRYLPMSPILALTNHCF